MLRRNKPSVLAALSAMTLCAHGQSIADYSRAQRELLEISTVQAVARAIGPTVTPASEAATTSRPAPSPVGNTPPGTNANKPVPMQDDPDIRLNGVVATANHCIAEMSINGVAYLLLEGSTLPATNWMVRSVSENGVVIARQARARGALPPDAKKSRTYELAGFRWETFRDAD
jgi:hypothetical protein